MLFTDNVDNMDELVAKLGELDYDFGKVKVCVVCFVFDKDGKLVLNRRGPGARDEVGMLQAIGGSVNYSDVNFRDAMARELREEAGDAEFEIGRYLGAVLNNTIDSVTKEEINWIIIGYEGKILSGDVQNMEPDMCDGFERNFIKDFKTEEISRTTYIFMQDMLNNK